MCDGGPEDVVDAFRGVLGDVFLEGPRTAAPGEDALDGRRVERPEAGGVREGVVDIAAVVACAEQENLAGVVRPDARRVRCGKHRQECGGAVAHLLEGGAELVDVDGGLASGARMQAERVDLLAAATRAKLVAREAGEARPVDEELRLRNAQREEVGHVVIGDGVPVSHPLDVAVDAAEAIRDARGVVGMLRQRDQVGCLVAKPIEGRLTMTGTSIDDAIEPVGELRREVIAIAKGAAVEERALVLPEAPFDTWFGVGFPAHGGGPDPVVCGEGEIPRIVDGLRSLPAEHDGFLAVVLAPDGAAAEAREGALVAVHEGEEIGRGEDSEVFRFE